MLKPWVWIDIELPPPHALIAPKVQVAMMRTTKGDGKFVAHLAPKGTFLRELEMMRIARAAPANQAGLRSAGVDASILVGADKEICSSCWNSGKNASVSALENKQSEIVFSNIKRGDGARPEAAKRLEKLQLKFRKLQLLGLGALSLRSWLSRRPPRLAR